MHLVAHLPVEVEVDVGQVGPAGVQEALQRQVEAQRVDVGDLQQVADERVAGRAAQGHAVAAAAGVAGDVADDQEVAGQVARLDDGQLLAQPLAGRQAVAQVRGGAGRARTAAAGSAIASSWRGTRGRRQDHVARQHVRAQLLGQEVGVAHRLRQVAEAPPQRRPASTR